MAKAALKVHAVNRTLKDVVQHHPPVNHTKNIVAQFLNSTVYTWFVAERELLITSFCCKGLGPSLAA